jgi:hypothetical protein
LPSFLRVVRLPVDDSSVHITRLYDVFLRFPSRVHI